MIIPILEYRQVIRCSDEVYYPQLVGVDLSVKSISKINSGDEFVGEILTNKTNIFTQHYRQLPTVNGCFLLFPGIYSFTFEQGISLPSDHYSEIVPRSSLVRCGGVIGAGIYEPGYEVENIGCVVHLTNSIKIEVGARVAQIKVYREHHFGVYAGQWAQKDIK